MKKHTKIIAGILVCAALLLLGAPAAFAASGPIDRLEALVSGIDPDDGSHTSGIISNLFRFYAASARANFGILSRFNAKSHLAHNKALDAQLLQGGVWAPIDRQWGEPIDSIKYGTRNFSYNGCELIAVYNALLELGAPRDMSVIIYDFERCGAVWLEAEFGTKIAQYRRYLQKQGLRTEEFKTVAALDASRADGDIFIITYRNRHSFGIHTVMVKQANGELRPYNTAPGPYVSFEDMLEWKGAYLLGFRVSR